MYGSTSCEKSVFIPRRFLQDGLCEACLTQFLSFGCVYKLWIPVLWEWGVPHPKICAIHRVMFFGTTCRNGRIRFRPYTSDNHFWSCGKCTTRISYNTHFTHSKNVLSKSSLTKQLLGRHEPALSIRTCDRRRVFHRPPTRVGTITRKFSKWDQYHPHFTKAMG